MQRRVAILAVLAVLVGGVAIGVAAARQSDDDTSTATPTVKGQLESTTSSTEAATTTTELTPTSTPPTTRGSTTTTRRSTTTVARATTTTKAPANTTTTAAAPGPRCGKDHLTVSIVTDKPTYAPGQNVTATSTLRNKSTTTCYYRGYTFGLVFQDEAGKSFGGTAGIAEGAAEVAFRPGEAITRGGTWDHAGSPAGVYMAIATWGFGDATATASTSLILS